MPFSMKFSSPAKKAAKYEQDLRAALQANNQPKVISTFTAAFNYLCQEQQAQLLSDLVLTYEPQIADASLLKNNISTAGLKQALVLLVNNHLDEAALLICADGGFDREAIDLLARRGRAADLAQQLARNQQVDGQLLAAAITAWENYHGDIRLNSTLSDVLSSIGQSMPERIPDHPRAKEIGGQFETAALLYVKEGRLADAARCYEQADLPAEASRIYEYLGDNESTSRTAEAAGDLERALQFVVKPERKIKLLIQLGQFREAREFAPGLQSPDEYFDLIREQARQQMMARLRGYDFGGALELAEIAECEPSVREDIVRRGRQSFDGQIAAATSQADLKAIYRARVDFEERAGQFEEAGRLAEEVLGDLDRASLLYEKANLFHRAIETAAQSSGDGDTSAARIRLAELHERGGNLLNAARLYEVAGQLAKASALYESAQHFGKAIECYLKTPDPDRAVLVRLYAGAGEFEKIVELYLKSGTVPDLEQALELATMHKLTSHSRIVREKLAALTAGDEQDLDRCFTQARDEVRGAYSTVMGIDFGTTNSVAAIFNKASGKVEIIPTERGTDFEPSFFGVDDDNHPIFGEAARLRSLTAPECVAARVKRSLGEPMTFSIHGKSYRCEEIVAHVLQQLRANAVAYLQAKVKAGFYEQVKHSGLVFPADRLRSFLRSRPNDFHMSDVVLSVPAYFNDNQKRATRDSAEIAGLHVRRLLHEPTAAALAYSQQRPYAGKVAVIDLGGGTLDISIVDIGEGVADVQVIGGDAKLGGSDIDALLVQQVVNHIRATWGIELTDQAYPREMARLRDACEALKIDLSPIAQSTMELPHFLNRPCFTYTMTRIELEKLAGPIINRIQSALSATIKDYGGQPDRFLLIGNATKMPAIGELVKAQLPVKQLMGIDPGTAVAMGAALEGAVLAGDSKQVVVLDIVPFSLGIVVSPDQGEEVMNFLIAKNSTIPIKKSSMCTTKIDNQPNVHLRICQGESPQPQKNHFLGEFVLEGIPLAKAHEPAIEVTFDIGADCILTVTAVDKGTGHTRSIRIERAVALSPQEKRTLSLYFAQKEKAYSVEKDLERTRADIEALKPACAEALQTAERAIRDFFERFHERVEVNARLYRASLEQIAAIQEMFIQKDQFLYGLPRYRDRLASILNNLRQTEAIHLDFSDQALVSKLQERAGALANYRRSLEELRAAIEQEVTRLVTGWIQTLDSLEPDTAKMTPLEVASYHLIAGRAQQANDILEGQAASVDGLTAESFYLLLQCQVALGSRDAYRAACQRYGSLFGLVFPDFSHLNAYLRAVEDSIFMIQGLSAQFGVSGSGFCIAPQLVVTNRHVVEGLLPANVKIIGRHITHQVERIECDPTHDIAILRVAEPLKPFRLGESSFVEPGEQVLAVGFPAPGSAVHSENIFISSGIVNSIRKISASPERVVFIDAKIRGGMSGGPLINDLGEVVGIVTLVQVEMRQSEQGMQLVGDQPTALPIHLVKKYIQHAG